MVALRIGFGGWTALLRPQQWRQQSDMAEATRWSTAAKAEHQHTFLCPHRQDSLQQQLHHPYSSATIVLPKTYRCSSACVISHRLATVRSSLVYRCLRGALQLSLVLVTLVQAPLAAVRLYRFAQLHRRHVGGKPARCGHTRQQRSALEQMPAEILLQIMAYLSTGDLARLALSSRRLHQLFADTLLWRVRLQTDFRSSSVWMQQHLRQHTSPRDHYRKLHAMRMRYSLTNPSRTQLTFREYNRGLESLVHGEYKRALHTAHHIPLIPFKVIGALQLPLLLLLAGRLALSGESTSFLLWYARELLQVSKQVSTPEEAQWLCILIPFCGLCTALHDVVTRYRWILGAAALGSLYKLAAVQL